MIFEKGGGGLRSPHKGGGSGEGGGQLWAQR